MTTSATSFIRFVCVALPVFLSLTLFGLTITISSQIKLTSFKVHQTFLKLIANVHEAISMNDNIHEVECWYSIVWEEWELVPFLWEESSAQDIFLATKLDLHTINFFASDQPTFQGQSWETMTREWSPIQIYFIPQISDLARVKVHPLCQCPSQVEIVVHILFHPVLKTLSAALDPKN